MHAIGLKSLTEDCSGLIKDDSVIESSKFYYKFYTNTHPRGCFRAADTLLYALSQFISFPSVSNSEPHKEDCRQAARWLQKCFTQLGAESQLVRSTLQACDI